MPNIWFNRCLFAPKKNFYFLAITCIKQSTFLASFVCFVRYETIDHFTVVAQ